MRSRPRRCSARCSSWRTAAPREAMWRRARSRGCSSGSSSSRAPKARCSASGCSPWSARRPRAAPASPAAPSRSGSASPGSRGTSASTHDLTCSRAACSSCATRISSRRPHRRGARSWPPHPACSRRSSRRSARTPSRSCSRSACCWCRDCSRQSAPAGRMRPCARSPVSSGWCSCSRAWSSRCTPPTARTCTRSRRSSRSAWLSGSPAPERCWRGSDVSA